MADSPAVEIPRRALFKAAEVCDLLKVQPYVLRTWEAEFPKLGVARAAGGPRVYRRADVEQVARIKHLLMVEGLTLAGARKRLEDDKEEPAAAGESSLDALFGRNARERIADVKRGLRALLDLLGGNGHHGDARAAFAAPRQRPVAVARVKAARGKSSARRSGRRAR